MTTSPDVVHLRRAGVSVLIDARGNGQPALLHWGADLGVLDATELDAVLRAVVPPVPHAVADAPPARGLLPERACGYQGRPGLSGHRAGADFAPRLIRTSTERTGTDVDSDVGVSDALTFVLDDVAGGLSIRSEWRLDPSGLRQVQQAVTNVGSTPYQLAELAVVLPVPATATELMDFTGRWCRERAPQRLPLSFGARTRENRHGRTGADSAFVTIAGSTGFANRRGAVWAVHLAWSGDQVTWAEAHPDGTRVIGAAELLAPGEIELGPGETYSAPTVFAAFSDVGLDGVAARFHEYLRSRPGHPVAPRPAVLNTWEAVYFDHDLERLTGLADGAAAARHRAVRARRRLVRRPPRRHHVAGGLVGVDRECGRRACGRWSGTSPGSACSSGCGWNPRW